jgi:hypothetical protein
MNEITRVTNVAPGIFRKSLKDVQVNGKYIPFFLLLKYTAKGELSVRTSRHYHPSERPCLPHMQPACCILRTLLTFAPALKCLLLACACYSLSVSLSCSCLDTCPHALHAACVQLLTCCCTPTALRVPAPAARVLLLACCCTPAHGRGDRPLSGDLLRLRSLSSSANIKHLL